MGFAYDSEDYVEQLYDNFKGEKLLNYDDEEIEHVDTLDDQYNTQTAPKKQVEEEKKGDDEEFTVSKMGGKK